MRVNLVLVIVVLVCLVIAGTADAALMYNGHEYALTPERGIWSEAEAMAVAWGGHLVTINDATEQAWVEDAFPDPTPAPGNWETGRYWIGLNDIDSEGTYVWASGEPVTYTNWGSGEPNNAGDEDATTIWRYDTGVWNDEPVLGWQGQKLYGIMERPYIEVDIDIKPGSDPNSINLKSKGVVPVAILTTDDFDATTVDPLSVMFGPGEATECHEKGHIDDVDGDGDVDMVLHFRTQETGIQPGDTEACLIGKTTDGMAIKGCDSIRTVGGPKKAPSLNPRRKLTNTWGKLKAK